MVAGTVNLDDNFYAKKLEVSVAAENLQMTVRLQQRKQSSLLAQEILILKI